jgi:hypothetical protein
MRTGATGGKREQRCRAAATSATRVCGTRRPARGAFPRRPLSFLPLLPPPLPSSSRTGAAAGRSGCGQRVGELPISSLLPPHGSNSGAAQPDPPRPSLNGRRARVAWPSPGGRCNQIPLSLAPVSGGVDGLFFSNMYMWPD